MAFHQKVFFLLLMLLPTQLGFHFWPDWAMVLGRRVDYLSPTVYLTDVFVILLLVSWFFDSFHHKFLISNFKFLIHKLSPVLLFVAFNILFAINKPVVVYKWLKVLEFVGLGWYIVQTKPKFSFIIQALSLGVLYSSAIAIIQFFLQHSIGGLFWFLGERTFSVDTPGIARMSWGRDLLRPYATFPHPNVLGGYLAVILPLAIWQISNLKSQISKIFYGVTIFFGFVALVLTFSRSAWVIGILGISIAYYVVSKKRSFFLPLLVLLFALVFKFNVNEESVVVRQQLNSVAISMWQQFPLFGVGLGNFLVKLPDVLVSRNIYFLQPVHNIYLLILSETGIIGFLFFGWLIFYAMMKHESGIMNYGKNKNSLFIIRISLFMILLLGLVDHYPITLQQAQLLLTILLVLQYTPLTRV